MNINILDGEKYIPTIFNNDKDPAPITFNLKYLTVNDQTETEYYQIQTSGGKVRGKVDYADAFRRGVESIDNCIINGKPILSASDFLDIRGSKKMTLIMQNVAQRLHDVSEIDEKNSPAPLASGPEA
jgi:hypothetical protein